MAPRISRASPLSLLPRALRLSPRSPSPSTRSPHTLAPELLPQQPATPSAFPCLVPAATSPEADPAGDQGPRRHGRCRSSVGPPRRLAAACPRSRRQQARRLVPAPAIDRKPLRQRSTARARDQQLHEHLPRARLLLPPRCSAPPCTSPLPVQQPPRTPLAALLAAPPPSTSSLQLAPSSAARACSPVGELHDVLLLPSTLLLPQDHHDTKPSWTSLYHIMTGSGPCTHLWKAPPVTSRGSAFASPSKTVKEYHYRRRHRIPQAPRREPLLPLRFRVPLPSSRSRVPRLPRRTCTTTVAEDRQVNNYRRRTICRVPLLPRRLCTTTAAT